MMSGYALVVQLLRLARSGKVVEEHRQCLRSPEAEAWPLLVTPAA